MPALQGNASEGWASESECYLSHAPLPTHEFAGNPLSAIPRAGAFEFSVSSRAFQGCQRRYFLPVFFADFLAFLATFLAAFFFFTAFFFVADFFAAGFFADGFFGGFGLRKGIAPFSTLPSFDGGSLSPGASFKALSTLH